ncbi:MAG TPA: ATP--guanido phosphotransferase [Lentisphaeria bacterium]|nr:MAG: protein arginine kinase [Lentisphaerae bacterium GWF2_38_69]HBM16455.1 ATP--guanido phosphotransferase [Lentisphaeria bacterium]
MKSNFDNTGILIKKPVAWLSADSTEPQIAISSRIRLARNIANLKFPITSSDNERDYILEIISGACDKVHLFNEKLSFNMSQLSQIERKFLLERHLVSREFCSGNKGSSLFIDSDESFGLMINEEDHLRMQIFSPGIKFKALWENISQKESLLNNEIPFAFDSKLGFLTSCPTNIGTGIRVSAMLSLPALTLSTQINQIIYATGKLGMTVRGLYGEGSEALGYIYQLSNQSTLGENEEEIIGRVGSTVNRMIQHELDARTLLIQNRRDFLSDFIGRSYAIMRHSYLITEKEALNALSAIRMGLDLNMFDSLDMEKVNALFVMVQDAHLQKCLRKELKPPELDAKRAELIRKFLIN